MIEDKSMCRWEVGFRNIVTILYGARKKFEISNVVEDVRNLLDANYKTGRNLLEHSDALNERGEELIKLREENERLRGEMELIRDLIEHDPRATKNERHICSIAVASLTSSVQPEEKRPTHTDLMVSPESIDEYLAREAPDFLEEEVLANPSPGFSYTRREIQIRMDERQKCAPSTELLEAVRTVVSEFRKYTNNESDWGDVMAEVAALDRLVEVK